MEGTDTLPFGVMKHQAELGGGDGKAADKSGPPPPRRVERRAVCGPP